MKLRLFFLVSVLLFACVGSQAQQDAGMDGALIGATLKVQVVSECNCEAYVLSFATKSNYLYKVQSTLSLTPPIQWADFTGVLTANDTNVEWALSAVQQLKTENRFFRVVEMPLFRLHVSTDASAPPYSLVAAGSSNVTVNVLKFTTSNEGVDLQSIGLKLGFPDESSASDLLRVTIWDGTTQVGEPVFVGNRTTAFYTLTSPLYISKNTDKILTIKADLSMIGTNEPIRVSGHRLAVDYDNTNPSRTYGVGMDSGERVWALGPVKDRSEGVRIMKSFPTFATDTLPSSGLGDGRLMRFKVTADSAGSVSLRKISLWINPIRAEVENMNLYGYTDPFYSNPISGVGVGGQVSSTNFNNSSTPVVSVYADTAEGLPTAIVIPAGQTYYFEMRGDVQATSTSYAVGTLIVSDGYDGLGFSIDTPENLQAIRSRAVIWSPNSRGISSLNDSDWTDGREVKSLPSEGKVRSQ